MSGVSFNSLAGDANKVFNDVFHAASEIPVVGKLGSEAWHGVQKDVIHPIFSNNLTRWIAIAAIAYFTAGIAMMYFPATAGFAASMPGVTSVASMMGLTGGAATAELGAGAGAGATTATAAAGTGAGVGTGTSAIDAAASAAIPDTSATLGAGVGTGAGATTATAAAGTGAGLTSGEELGAAYMGANLLQGAMAPSVNQQMNAEKQFRGAYFGNSQQPQFGASQPVVPPGGFNLMESPKQTTIAPGTAPTTSAPTQTTQPAPTNPFVAGAAPSMAAATQAPAMQPGNTPPIPSMMPPPTPAPAGYAQPNNLI